MSRMSLLSGGTARRNGPRTHGSRHRRLMLEMLEDRQLLSAGNWDENGVRAADANACLAQVGGNAGVEDQAPRGDAPRFAPGEILVGFEGDVVGAYHGKGPAAALEAAGKLVGADGLTDPEAVLDMPATTEHGARLATHWRLPPGADVLEAVRRLAGRPGIAYAEPNYLASITSVPNDPSFGQLWAMNNTTQTGGSFDADIDASEAWDTATGSRKVVVGDIDTGIDYTHPDLYQNVWLNQGEIPTTLKSKLVDTDLDGLITFVDLNQPVNAGYVSDSYTQNGYIDAKDLLSDSRWADGRDSDGNRYVDDLVGWNFVTNTNNPMDDNGHGTHTAGTIGAAGNNDRGVVGVNWNVQLMALKFLDSGGSGTYDNAVKAINYATWMRGHGTNVVETSNSWGGTATSSTLSSAISKSGSAGLLFVAAAGNSGVNTDASPQYPSAYTLANIIAVAATDHNDAIADFSNWGPTSVDLGAPGVDILSTFPKAKGDGSGYAILSGTSMATPHVAGAAALLCSMAPAATYTQVRSAILGGVDKLPSIDAVQGSATPVATGGRLNLVGAMGKVAMVVASSTPSSDSVYSGDTARFTVDFSSPVATINSGKLLTVEDAAGVVVASGTPVAPVPGSLEVTYTFSNPITASGTYRLSLPEGAVTTSASLPGGSASKAWNASFRYTSMKVASIEPPAAVPVTSLAVHFSQPYDAASVDTTDLVVSMGSVTGVNLVDPDTVEYMLSGVINEGELVVQVPAGAVADVNHFPVVAFSTRFELDYGSPTNPSSLVGVAALEAVEPLGSLIYQATLSGMIGSAGDTDSFRIKLDPGQAVSAVVDSAQAMEVETAGPIDGNYTITVGSVDGTSTGTYTLQVALNAAFEEEAHGGAANDTRTTAQSINGSFIALPGGGQRGAVLGRISAAPVEATTIEGFETSSPDTYLGTYYTFDTDYPEDASLGAGSAHDGQYGLRCDALFGSLYRKDVAGQVGQEEVISAWVRSSVQGNGWLNFGVSDTGQYSLFVDGYEGNLKLLLNSTALASVSQWWIPDRWYRLEVAWSKEGTIVGRLFDSDGVTLLNTVTAIDNTYTSGAVGFACNGYSTEEFDTVQVLPIGSSFYEANQDNYSFTLPAGETATLALTWQNRMPFDLDLSDEEGNVLPAMPTGENGNTEWVQYSNARSGPMTIVAHVSATGTAAGEYSLVVTRGADFDLDPNSGPAPWSGQGAAQVLSLERPVLGYANRTGTAIENFEEGNLNGFSGPGMDTATLTRDAAHDGAYGLALAPGDTYFTDWIYRDDEGTRVDRGDVISAWVRSSSIWGRAYLGFGATAEGTYSLQMAPNTSEFILGINEGYEFQNLGVVAQTWEANHWYRMEVSWGFDGTMVGRLFDSDGTTLLNTVTGSDTTYASGGIAFRGFDGSKYFDTVTTQSSSDFYEVVVPEGLGPRWLNVNVVRPAAGPDEFDNQLNPKVRIYNSTGTPLGADGDWSAPRDAQLSYPIPAGGTYYVEVRASDSTAVLPSRGEYVLTTALSGQAPSPRVIVSNTSLVTSEATGPGHAQTVWVVLSDKPAEPAAGVTIAISSSDAEAGTVSINSLTFTAANWNQPQSFEVTGVDNLVDAADRAYRVSLTASSGDLLYNNAVVEIAAINLDDDTAGIVVTPASLETTEAAGPQHSATFYVKLNSEPAANVMIAVHSGAAAEGLVSAGELTFTPLTWNVAQPVTVTSVDDAINDGPAAYVITLDVSSGDAAYLLARPKTVAVRDRDNDAPSNVIEAFAADSLTSNKYTLKNGTASGMTVTAAAARDSDFGLQHDGSSSAWIVRTDSAVLVQPGQTFSVYLCTSGTCVPGEDWSRAYFGFGAGRKGTYSLAMGTNTGVFELNRVDNYTTYTVLAKVNQTWLPNTWYRLELQWTSTTTGDNLFGRLYTFDFALGREVLLNTISARDTTFTSGGIAFRGFGSPFYYDTVRRSTGSLTSTLGSESSGKADRGMQADAALAALSGGSGHASAILPLAAPPAGSAPALASKSSSAAILASAAAVAEEDVLAPLSRQTLRSRRLGNRFDRAILELGQEGLLDNIPSGM